MEQALATAWGLASGTREDIVRRGLETGPLSGVPTSVASVPPAADPLVEAGRAGIVACLTQSCAKTAAEALPLQVRVAAEFLASKACRDGRVGAEYARVMAV